MRLLLVNPNMTRSMTDDMTAIARRVAGDRAEIVPVTATRGFPYISSRAEAQIAGGIALEMIADNLDGIDAVIIAAFGDPGLRAAREVFDLPVIGMAEAAITSACMLGERFSIVTFSPAMSRWYLDCAQDSGQHARCTGVRTPADHPMNVTGVRDAMRDELTSLATLAAREDGADVVILGGAPLAGMAQDIAQRIPALVVDPITAATAMAIAMGQVVTKSAFPARLAKPMAKASTGLAPRLSRIIACEAAS